MWWRKSQGHPLRGLGEGSPLGWPPDRRVPLTVLSFPPPLVTEAWQGYIPAFTITSLQGHPLLWPPNLASPWRPPSLLGGALADNMSLTPSQQPSWPQGCASRTRRQEVRFKLVRWCGHPSCVPRACMDSFLVFRVLLLLDTLHPHVGQGERSVPFLSNPF